MVHRIAERVADKPAAAIEPAFALCLVDNI